MIRSPLGNIMYMVEWQTSSGYDSLHQNIELFDTENEAIAYILSQSIGFTAIKTPNGIQYVHNDEEGTEYYTVVPYAVGRHYY